MKVRDKGVYSSRAYGERETRRNGEEKRRGLREGRSPRSELGLFIALVNLVTHLPFTDLPVLKHYELGELRSQYDYVIVGGGSAGCVIANRLSANPNVTVLLLEAGGLETASRQIPAAAPFNLKGHDDRDYHSVPQSNAALSFREQAGTFIDLRRLPLSRGKVLGGSSVLNFMLYTRGNPGDYERWVRDYGATGWGYQDVLPHFKEIEDYRAGPVDQYHGSGGEVPVDHANTSTLLSHLLLKACNESGYSYVDFNGPTQTGTFAILTRTEFMQFLHTADNATDSDIPDIEIVPISTSPASELFKAMMVELGLMPEAFDGIIGPTDGRLSFRGVVVLNRPKSGGSITLHSADPNDDPDIDPRILEHPDDVRRAAEGTRKLIDQVLGTEAMQSIGAKPWNVTFTLCAEAGALWSQGYIEYLFRHAAHTM
ncbi:hypothetical protein MRX96_027076 [Rhipicephalus microplus]